MRLLRTHVTKHTAVNPRNMKKFCSQLSTYFRKADEWLVRSGKTWQFPQTCIITFNNKYNFRVFYRRTNSLSLYCKGSTVIVFIFFFISTTHIIKFSIYLCSKFVVLYRLISSTAIQIPSQGALSIYHMKQGWKWLSRTRHRLHSRRNALRNDQNILAEYYFRCRLENSSLRVLLLGAIVMTS
jgi:hypothetical protein